jgi:hypothetical protein
LAPGYKISLPGKYLNLYCPFRLGKKKMEPKEKEVKTVDGITRLICLSKGHNTPLKVAISA